MDEPIREEGDAGEGPFMGLVLRYFDGELDEAELAELNGMLREDESKRSRFVEYCSRSWLIRETFDPQKQKVGNMAEGRGTPEAGRRVVRMLAGAVAALVVGMGVLLFRMNREERPIGTLEDVSGAVIVIGRDGQSRAVATTSALNAGDTIRTRGGQSSAAVVYADGTRMTLVGDSSITCVGTNAKSVVVHQGKLAAAVRPQPPDRPMTLATPAAQVQVLGTRFLLDALDNRTDLSVSEGRVRLTRVSDRRSVDVTNGEQAIVAGAREMVVRNIPTLSRTWEADFENGLPQGWEGEMVTSALLPGSRGAIRVVRDESGEWSIRSNQAWSEGLFDAGRGSHFHMTFKMEFPAWINVLFSTRTGDPGDLQFAGNFLCNEFSKVGQSRWQTVSIPFSSFKRLHRSERLEKLVPFRVVIATGVADGSLVIDRMWVTPDGPGKTMLSVME